MLSSDGQKIALKIRKCYSYIGTGKILSLAGNQLSQEVLIHGMEFWTPESYQNVSH